MPSRFTASSTVAPSASSMRRPSTVTIMRVSWYAELTRELGEPRQHGERRRLPESAERGELHRFRQCPYARRVDVRLVEQREHPRRPLATRCALAARLARVEGKQRAHRVAHARRIAQRDDTPRSGIHRAARDQRLVELARRHDAAGWPAEHDRADRSDVAAAADLLAAPAHRRAHLPPDHARAPHGARAAEETPPAP